VHWNAVQYDNAAVQRTHLQVLIHPRGILAEGFGADCIRILSTQLQLLLLLLLCMLLPAAAFSCCCCCCRFKGAVLLEASRGQQL
jgi:hypothetical protein